MAKLGACLLLVVGTAVICILVAPFLGAPSDVAAVMAQDSLPDSVATGCAAALVLAWGWFLVGTAVCLAEEVGARRHGGSACRRDVDYLRPAVARRLAAVLVGGGLTWLVVHPVAPSHATGPDDLPLPARPLGGESTRAPQPSGHPAPDIVVVRSGDSLWSIAASRLVAAGDRATPAAIDAAWRRLHARNRSTIGPVPDLIHPGARLRMP